MNRWLKWALVILIIILVGVGGFFAGKFYWQKSASNTKSNGITATSSAGTKSAGNEQAAGNEKGCWKTYKNVPVGYSINHPCNWTLTETSEFNETFDATVKHITIKTPDSKYFLYWGYKKSNEQNFTYDDRTGVGAGDFVNQPGMAFQILGVNVTPKQLVYQNKVKEYFYEEPLGGVAQCSCNFVGYFSYDQSQNYDQVDMTNLNYVTTVKQILLSAQKI
jgi:hypothetical protein